ncbi:Glucan endo-1,3-beta-glucosidase [Vitis vinifera]|uniref:glucan endo-1,3-beta-D-glucosidase n=1 Tax=Vitis vinifera TaxID=29760 RepID=A0A438F2P7_VITVI|nr:Glucan endo-1,3-beta-glucosidase [Vitis vinifera]
MALTRNRPFVVVLLLGFVIMSTITIGAQSIGVCYGTNGNNLPSASQVINLYKSNGIGSMRIYDPNSDTLQELRGSDIELILDVPNTDLQSLASDASAAATWVQNNVVNYASEVKFRYIAVGNEVLPTGSNAQYAQYVLPAMKNVQSAITSSGLQGQIKVSTATYSAVLGKSYPPSEGSFSDDVSSFINPIISFLAENGSPLLANIYPYFSYTGDTQNIRLDYALFTASGVVAGGSNLQIVVSESGWPSEGGTAATVDNARTYYSNLINHVKGAGTPRKPGQAIETYLFAMFDENQKTGLETEKHFGLFTPSQESKYQISFS